MSEQLDKCAVWFAELGRTEVSVHACEADAAAYAAELEYDGGGKVEGVQFADGRILDRRHWKAVDQALADINCHTSEQPIDDQLRSLLISPFSGAAAIATLSAVPAWLGQATRSELVRRSAMWPGRGSDCR